MKTNIFKLPALSILCFAVVGFISCAVDASGDGDEENSISLGATPLVTDTPSTNPIFDLGSLGRTTNYCGTAEPDNTTLNTLSTGFSDFKLNTASRLSSAVRRDGFKAIPVIFHVISSGDSVEEGEVSDDSLIEQIAVLNRAYSGETGGVRTPFEFTLSGINRVRRPEWAKIAPASELEVDMKMELRQGGPETLNVYLTAIDGGELGEVLGVATLPVFYPVVPFFDGVTINFRTLPAGPLEFFNVGHVLVHEVGHWLGLLHTFQGQCDGIVDDLVEDTPREKIPGSGDFCPVGRDSCPDSPGIDPINNHMTYTEDSCRFEFTAEQVQFMRFNATVFRGLAE